MSSEPTSILCAAPADEPKADSVMIERDAPALVAQLADRKLAEVCT